MGDVASRLSAVRCAGAGDVAEARCEWVVRDFLVFARGEIDGLLRGTLDRYRTLRRGRRTQHGG